MKRRDFAGISKEEYMPYRFIARDEKHAQVEVTGKTIQEAFMDGARAAFEIVGGTEPRRGGKKIECAVQGQDLSVLFGEWLMTLMFRADAESLLLGDFEVFSFQKVTDGYLLTGGAYGDALPKEIRGKIADFNEKSFTAQCTSDDQETKITLDIKAS